MIVQHNMTAANNNRQLAKSTKNRANIAEKLSSGYRVNRAADDAAGLSISEKMRGQIRGLNRASLNADEGVSLIQTAEGALHEIHGMLHRMEELSVQAANDTNTEADRQAIQYEIDYLVDEIDRISEDTEYNTLRLLSGDYAEGAGGSTPIQTASSMISVTDQSGGMHVLIYYEDGDTSDFATTQTGGGGTTKSLSDFGISYSDAAFKKMLEEEIVPQAVMGIMNTFSSTFGYLNGSSIGIGLNLYQDNSNTLASVTLKAAYSTGVVNGQPSVTDTDLTYTLSINLKTLFDSSGNLVEESRNNLEVTVIHEMMHAMMDEALTTGMLGLAGSGSKITAFPGWFKEGMAQVAAGGCYDGNDWVNGLGGLGITSATPNSTIRSVLAGNAIGSNSTPSNYGTGYLASMYLGYLAGGGGSVSASGIQAGVDKLLDEIKQGSSLDDAIKKLTNGQFQDTSDFEARFASYAGSGSNLDTATFVHNLVALVDGGTGGLVADFSKASKMDMTKDNILPDGTKISTPLFDLDTTKPEVANDYPNGYTVLSGGGRSNAGTSPSGNAGGSGGSGGPGGSGGSGGSGGGSGGGTGGPGGSGGGTGGTTGNGGLILQVGANAGQCIRLYIGNMSSSGIGLTGISVMSHADAEQAITMAHNAVEKVSLQRTKLGAYQNRLLHTIDNADNMAENLQSSESKIRDANMAKEMVAYSKEDILMQAGQAMLAQTNQMTKGVLKLLQ